MTGVISSSPVLRVELRTLLAKWLFLACIAVPLLGYSALVTRIYLADHAAQRLDLSHLQEAVRLQPGNAEYWDLLGRYYLLSESDLNASIAHHLQAVAVNPRVSRYWLNLAMTYTVARDAAKERDALDHALAADPEQPAVAWEGALHYAVADNPLEARRRLRVVVAHDPTRRDMAFDLAYRISSDIPSIVRDVFPDDAQTQLAFAYYLVDHNRPDDLGVLWDHLAGLHPTLPAERCVPLITYLADHGKTAAAVRAWRSLSGIAPGFERYEWGSNLVVNGSFEEDLLNGGFDWRVYPREHVALAEDTTIFHGGSRSILATFDGAGDGYTGLMQMVPVEPSTQYVLSGFLRGGELDSAAGPRLIVSNRKTYAVIATSNTLEQNSAWHEVETEFTSPPDADQVIVMIGQAPEAKIMKGKLWIDDIQMRKK